MRVRRRAFLRAAGAGLAVGSVTGLAACGDDEEAEPASDVEEQSVATADAGVLNAALELENEIVAAYTAGSPLLRGNQLKLVRRILAHEQAHADALAQAIRGLGHKPVSPKPAYEFPAMRTGADVLRHADELENQAIAAYIDALPKLTDSELKATVAAILTSEGEHLSVLAGLRGRRPAPEAFVLGRRPADRGAS